MEELLNRPELALAAALAVVLAWVLLAFGLKIQAVGDEVGARLDALRGADLESVPTTDRYARFEHRDYAGDRGPCPTAAPRYASVYAELVARLGFDPLGGAE